MAVCSPVARNPLRSARFDDLGLRRALGDRMLPLLVAAMAFLAALALAGVVGARSLSQAPRDTAHNSAPVSAFSARQNSSS